MAYKTVVKPYQFEPESDEDESPHESPHSPTQARTGRREQDPSEW